MVLQIVVANEAALGLPARMGSFELRAKISNRLEPGPYTVVSLQQRRTARATVQMAGSCILGAAAPALTSGRR